MACPVTQPPESRPPENEPREAGRRRAEIAANLAAVRARIDAACALAGRAASEITLIAVTKTFPASDIELLDQLGVRDVGENRDQEATAKVAELTTRWGEPARERLRWHFIGGLQTNKCASVVGYADVVHSVDRSRLVDALSAAASRAGRTPRCLVQVSLDDAPASGRAGVCEADAVALADAIARAPGLALAGVMGVAPLGGDPARAFARLARAAERVRAEHPDASVVSAGMSGDLEAAIMNGATHLRVGAALLGSRRDAG